MNPAFFVNEFNDIVYDEKIDIWALGVLCYEMFTGQKPYQIENFVRSIDSINITFPKNISLVAQSFLSSMLCKNRDKRLSASQLLNHEFIIRNLDEIKQNEVHLYGRPFIYNTPNKKIINNKSRYIQYTHTRQISMPTYGSQTNNISLQLRNSVKPNNLTRSFYSIVQKPLFKKYFIGNNIDKNQLNIIINCCNKYYIQFRGGKNTAIHSAETIKQILGGEWMVFISDLQFREFDFYLSPGQQKDCVVFSLDNKFFQVCRYKID